METGRCHTCRWWERNPDRGIGRLDGSLGECSAPKIHYGCHVQTSDVEPDGALIEDDEGWGMLTGPEFGCVQWEAGEK